MSTTTTSTATTQTQVLSEADRVRLARKDVQNRAIDLERVLGKNLQAWYNIALHIERSQVNADRVGAMLATTQQQSKPAEVRTIAASATSSASVAAATSIVVKQEPTPAEPPTPAAAAATAVKTEPVPDPSGMETDDFDLN